MNLVINGAMASLGVTRLSRVLVALGVVAVLAAAGGVYAGLRWERGTQAIAGLEVREKQIAALQRAATDLRDGSVENAAAYVAASKRMDSIASTLEHEREANRQFAQGQIAALQELENNRPDLRGLDLGPDILRHWNRSNAGSRAAATSAAPGPASQPKDAVPRPAAGQLQPGTGTDSKPRPGHDALPPVQGDQQQPAAGRQRMGADRLGVVLPATAPDRRARTRLSCATQRTGPSGAVGV